MRRLGGLAAVAAAAMLLAACDREPVRTVVIPPRAPAEAPAAAPAPVPAAEVPAPAPTAQMGAAPAASAPPFQGEPGDREGARFLAARSLMIPVAGIAPGDLRDTYEQGRAGHTHEAIDIAAPVGTPVVAVDNGRIAKLFTSKPGGLTVYQFDSDGRLAYYYAHLDAYAPGLQEGMEVRRGMPLGTVGSTGNADPKAPHLHFAVFRLGPEQRWWEGAAINPFPALRLAAPAEVIAAR